MTVRPSIPLLLMAGLLILLWIAGGSSRGDVLGQAVVRAGAVTAIIIALLAGPRPDFQAVKPVLFIVSAAVAIPLVQLIPIPLSWWLAMPGREVFTFIAHPTGWMPITISPGATMNALASLLVPIAATLIISQIKKDQIKYLSDSLFIMIIIAIAVGLIQFSGLYFKNPFINDHHTNVSSVFANRNHFALLVAMGLISTVSWGVSGSGTGKIRVFISSVFSALLFLTALAIGSRSGLVLFILSAILSLVLFKERIRNKLKDTPRRITITLAIIGVLITVLLVWISSNSNRVEAVDRLLELAVEEDLRTRTRSTLVAMVANYFPFGAGLGSFDTSFRLSEPWDLLSPLYFNQAHNDYFGLALDAGLLGCLVLAAAIGWWAVATIRVVRAPESQPIALARLGSAMLVLVFAASATDYPARTPIIMAIVVIAGAWLAYGSSACRRSALPQRMPIV